MDLVRSPQNFERHLERYAASVVMTVAYGKRVDDMNDPAVQMVLEMMQYMASLNVPGRFLAESFPVLAKFPDLLAPWKKEVKANAAYYGTLPQRSSSNHPPRAVRSLDFDANLGQASSFLRWVCAQRLVTTTALSPIASRSNSGTNVKNTNSRTKKFPPCPAVFSVPEATLPPPQ